MAKKKQYTLYPIVKGYNIEAAYTGGKRECMRFAKIHEIKDYILIDDD